jgi:hypothetical protein
MGGEVMGYKVVQKYKGRTKTIGYYPTKHKAQVKALKSRLMWYGKFTVHKTKR